MSVFDPAPLVAAVARSGAPYVLIGGVAVGLHGFVRATDDVDILVPDDRAARGSLADAIRPIVEKDEIVRLDEWVTAGGNLTRLPTEHGILDILEEGIGELAWDVVNANAETRDTEDGPIRVCGLTTLVTLKRLAGRPMDGTDLAELERSHGQLPEAPDI